MYIVLSYRIEEEKERVARGGTAAENEKTGRDEIEIAEVPLTTEQIAQNMITWRPYLAYVDDLISKALIQAVSSRYLGCSLRERSSRKRNARSYKRRIALADIYYR